MLPPPDSIFSQVQYFDPRSDIENEARNLPHWRQTGRTYFVTFRLGDSLPADKLRELQIERAQFIESHPQPWTEEVRVELHQRFTDRCQRWLDAGYGSCVLREPAIAKIVADALLFFDGQRYKLLAWVVMPNHVHALVTPFDSYPLDKILHSWQSFTSLSIHRKLGLEGALWQHEGYDHIVRSPEALRGIARYIVLNPKYAHFETEFVFSRVPNSHE